MGENIIKESDITKDDINKIFTDPNYIKKLDLKSDGCKSDAIIFPKITLSNKWDE